MNNIATPARVASTESGWYGRLIHSVARRPLSLFFFLAYVWSWTVWLIVPRIIHRRGLDVNHGDSVDLVALILGTFGPTIAALITRRITCLDLKICPVWTGWRGMLSGVAAGLGLFCVMAVLLPAVALAKAVPSALHWTVLIHWTTYRINYSTFLGGPVGEEPGWRGFALPKLQEKLSPLAASAILGLLWAAWHLPLFLMPDWSSASLWQFCLILIGVSMILTIATRLARFSVIVPILLHAFFNISSRLMSGLIADLPLRVAPAIIYSLVVCGGGVLLGLCFLRKRQS